jgi:hypothetical protein
LPELLLLALLLPPLELLLDELELEDFFEPPELDLVGMTLSLETSITASGHQQFRDVISSQDEAGC